jgi:hypothetical protein
MIEPSAGHRRPAAFVAPRAGDTPGTACRFCGRGPAINATFRRHTGLVILMRFGSLTGAFCRDCGIAAFRSATAATLLAGWWGIASFFVTPVVLLANVVHRVRLSDLRPPRDPALLSALPAQLDPGRPLYRRPAILGLGVPLAALILLAYSMVAAPAGPDPDVGRCVQSEEIPQLISCGAEHGGRVVAVTDEEEDCPPETAFVLYGADDGDRYLCVAPD